MDAFGTAASVVALLEISLRLVDFFKAMKKAEVEIHQLQSELSGLLALYTRLRALEDRVSRTTPEALQSPRNAIRSLSAQNGPLAEYQRLLSEISQKYLGKRTFKLRVTWANVKKDVLHLLAKLGRLQAAITNILLIDQAELLEISHWTAQEHAKRLKEMQTAIETNNETERLQVALSWISVNQYRSSQAHNRSLAQANTADWFIVSPEFAQWLEPSPYNIYCPGMPGAGKTVLAATIIDHLEKRIGFPAQDENLAYIFCDHESEDEQSESHLLGSIVQQLVQNDPTLGHSLLAQYEHHGQRRTFPDVNELFALLQNMTSKQKAVYIVVDALDELDDSRTPGTGSTGKRRSFIGDLQRLTTSSAVVRLLCTSRQMPEVDDLFVNDLKLEISARVGDIEQVIRNRLQYSNIPIDSTHEKTVIDAIISASDGLYRVMEALLNEFESLHNVKQIKQFVRELEDIKMNDQRAQLMYEPVYARSISRIKNQTLAKRQLALSVMRWLTCAGRLLTVSELRCALMIELGSRALDTDNAYSQDLILQVCAGLIVVNTETGIIRLAHHTVREYLDTLSEFNGPLVQLEIAQKCVTYLCFDRFGPMENPVIHGVESEAAIFETTPSWIMHSYVPSTVVYGYEFSHHIRESFTGGDEVIGVATTLEEQDVDAQGQLSLLDYAANHWFLHARLCEEEMLPLALRLLSDQRLAANAFVNATSLYEAYPFLSVERTQISKATGLHLAAATGSLYMLRELLVQLDAWNTSLKRKALISESEWIQSPTDPNQRKSADLQLLKPDLGDDKGRTALMWAAHRGHLDIVKLLTARPDVDSFRQCHSGETALHYACRLGHLDIADLILGINPYKSLRIRNHIGETAEVQAALAGHEDVLAMFHARGPDIYTYCFGDVFCHVHKEVSLGLWPVHLAAQRRSARVMKILAETYGADLDILNAQGYSPVVVAADWDNLGVLQYLLGCMDWSGPRRKNQLFKAAAVAASNPQRYGVFKTIVETNRDVLLFRDSHGQSLLDLAIDASNTHVTLLLRDMNIPVMTTTIHDVTEEQDMVRYSGDANERLLDFIRETMLAGDADTKAAFQPKFDPDQTNYILTFYGSFNPPHVGHLALLEDARINCGPGIKITCALIDPVDDVILRRKFRQDGFTSLLLPRDTRSRLWSANRALPLWAGVTKQSRSDVESRGEQHSGSEKQLELFAAELGYKISFIQLCGAPETMDVRKAYKLRSWDDPALINTYGRSPRRRNDQPFDFELEAWQKISTDQASINIFHNAHFTLPYTHDDIVRPGFVRVIEHQDYCESIISSTLIRRLYASPEIATDGAVSDILTELAINWNLLKDDADIRQWRENIRLSHIERATKNLCVNHNDDDINKNDGSDDISQELDEYDRDQHHRAFDNHEHDESMENDQNEHDNHNALGDDGYENEERGEHYYGSPSVEMRRFDFISADELTQIQKTWLKEKAYLEKRGLARTAMRTNRRLTVSTNIEEP